MCEPFGIGSMATEQFRQVLQFWCGCFWTVKLVLRILRKCVIKFLFAQILSARLFPAGRSLRADLNQLAASKFVAYVTVCHVRDLNN
jgi:hypothetical protein